MWRRTAVLHEAPCAPLSGLLVGTSDVTAVRAMIAEWRKRTR